MEIKGTGIPGVQEVIHSSRHYTQSTSQHEKAATEEKHGTEDQRKTTSLDREKLLQEVNGLNQMLDVNATALKFNVHDKLERTYVQVVDRNTEEVVREIPPEKFLDIVAAMLEHVGLIVDKKV
ncbi:flagellar protein FlaG [Thalassorhabdus alkalitolerans]|uniref:Flagellar protein FlaG n=1 Tax=Thalassorhabdus alkalitolerans TaxID=2282697 RepID=A0ABW0YLQ7_9BACI